jgi:peptidoglycan/xylan/chitin deacetylase (PgdA/CDA1 family)
VDLVKRSVAVFSFSAIAIALFLAATLGITHFIGLGNLAPSTAQVSNRELILSNFQSDHGFVLQSGTGTQLEDTTSFAIGNQSLKLVTTGDGSPVFTRKSDIVPALNFTDKLLKVWIKVNGTDSVSELRVTVTSDDFRTYTDYWIAGDAGAQAGFLGENRWNVLSLSKSHSTAVGPSDISRVDKIQIRVVDDGSGRPVTVWVNSLSLVARNDRPVVTFTFDDGFETDYAVARPVLDMYHFPATSYVIPSMVGGPDRLNLTQLRDLQDLNGWDIASHSFSHSNLTSIPSSEIENELLLSQQFLVNNGFQNAAAHFAYPYGEFDNGDLKGQVQKYYRTARTAEGELETLPPSDPYRLRAMVVTNSTTPSDVSERIQSAIANGDWLILVFHRIVESDADEEFKYPASDFRIIVDYVASRGVDVMTVSQVYDNKYR